MIIGGPAAHESKRHQKLTNREVNEATLGDAVLAFLKWSEIAITFDIKHHSDHIPQPGHFSLVVDPIIDKTRLSRVLMDGESGLNLLYAETYDTMGLYIMSGDAAIRFSIPCSHTQTSGHSPWVGRPKEKRSTKGEMPSDLSYDTSVMKMELH